MPVEQKTISGNKQQTFQPMGEEQVDLNQLLAINAGCTYTMQVNSDAMTGAGIFPGDMVLVDRKKQARNGNIIIALLDQEILIRMLEISNYKKILVPASNKLSSIEISDGAPFAVWGVVTHVIRKVGGLK